MWRVQALIREFARHVSPNFLANGPQWTSADSPPVAAATTTRSRTIPTNRPRPTPTVKRWPRHPVGRRHCACHIAYTSAGRAENDTLPTTFLANGSWRTPADALTSGDGRLPRGPGSDE